MAKRKTIEELKLSLWSHFIAMGYRPDTFNCLYMQNPPKERIRLNFRDDKILKMEVKRLDEETGKTCWILLEQSEYKEVKIGEDGSLVFHDREKQEKPKRKRSK